MPAQVNPETGLWEYTDPKAQGSGLTLQEESRPVGMSVVESAMYDQRQAATAEQKKFDDGIQAGDDRPLLAQGPGQFAGDLFNVATNSLVALGTDYVDLGLGVADVVGQTAKAIAGQGFNTDEIFDDSDNPLTQWRRETFKTQTQAGQAASYLARTITSLITLPKTAIKVLAAPAKILGGIDKLGDAGRVFGKIGKGLDKADAALKAGNAPKVTKAMQALSKGDAADKATKNAAKIAGNADWLSGTFSDISKSTEAVNWWNGVSNSVGALTQLRKVKGTVPKIKTVGQALGWDAFVAFNIYGEGDSEFDETMTDMLEGWGLPNVGYFQTGVNDTSMERKWKQMAEGLVMGTGLSAFIDAARIYKYSRAFSAASPEGKAQLLKAFEAESETLGRGVAEMLDPWDVGDVAREARRPMRPGWDPSLDPWEGGALARLNNQVGIERINNQYQTDMTSAAIQEADVRVTPGGALPPGQQPLLDGQQVAGQIEGANPNALPPGRSPEPKPGSTPAGTLGAGGELVDGRIEPVDVRPLEPTVTPQTIRNAVAEDAYKAFKQSLELVYDEVAPGKFEEIGAEVRKLMPRTRVDLVEYINKFPPVLNNLGVVSASDSIWMNMIANRGLAEGWATLDPVDLALKFNRRLASELDQGDLAMRQAEKLDEALELRRYEDWLKQVEPMNPGQLDTAVQDDLAKKDAVKAYDDWENSQARKLVDREAATAEVQAQQFDNAEEARLSAAEELALQGQLGDEAVAREMLGTDLNQVKGPDIEKAQTGRGWEVKGEDGEVLGTYTRKSQAEKAAAKETERLKQAMINRARQVEADGADQTLNMVYSNPYYESDLAAKVKLTMPQVREMLPYSNALKKQFKAGVQTYEIKMSEMFDLVDGMNALLQTGEMTGNRGRVIRNLRDKLGTQIKLLEPAARAEIQARGMANDVGEFLVHGEFC